jgi:hypothetical protein
MANKVQRRKVMSGKEDKLSLAAKISMVMQAIEYVNKGGTNTAQGYKFVQATDVAKIVRHELGKLNVAMIPAKVEVAASGLTPKGTQSLLTVVYTWRLIDGDSGETLEFQSIGTGADSGDKAAYKAATGALKYALLTTFLIPTGDDPEHDANVAADDAMWDKAIESVKSAVKPLNPVKSAEIGKEFEF